MQDKTNTDERYVPIGEAAQMLGVSKDTLRRWEKKGKIVTRRSPTNHRYYAVSHLHDLMEAKFPPPPVPTQLKAQTRSDLVKPTTVSIPTEKESAHKPILNPLPNTPKDKPAESESEDKSSDKADIANLSLTPMQAKTSEPKPVVEKKEPITESSLNENKEWMPIDMDIKNINLSGNTPSSEPVQKPETPLEKTVPSVKDEVTSAKLEPIKKPAISPNKPTLGLNDMVTKVKVHDKAPEKKKLLVKNKAKAYILIAVIAVVLTVIIVSLGFLIIPHLDNISDPRTGQNEVLSPLSD